MMSGAIARRWRGLQGWERAVWLACAGTLALSLAWPLLLRSLAPQLAAEAAAIDLRWSLPHPEHDAHARDPWGNGWLVVSVARGDRLLHSAGPDGERGGEDDLAVEPDGFGRGWIASHVQGLLLVAALLLPYFVHAPWVRWPRAGRWKEAGYIALTALPVMALCVQAAFVTLGVPLMMSSPTPSTGPSVTGTYLVIEPWVAVIVTTVVAVALAAALARVTLRGPAPTDGAPSPPSAAGGSPS